MFYRTIRGKQVSDLTRESASYQKRETDRATLLDLDARYAVPFLFLDMPGLRASVRSEYGMSGLRYNRSIDFCTNKFARIVCLLILRLQYSFQARQDLERVLLTLDRDEQDAEGSETAATVTSSGTPSTAVPRRAFKESPEVSISKIKDEKIDNSDDSGHCHDGLEE